MAKYLGCNAVSVKIRRWLAGGLGSMSSSEVSADLDHSKSGDEDAIAWLQVRHPRPTFVS